jgi:hypothetical protein
MCDAGNSSRGVYDIRPFVILLERTVDICTLLHDFDPNWTVRSLDNG